MMLLPNTTAVGGGAAMAKSGDAKTLKPGIRLHFYRYGLFHKESVQDIGYNIHGPSGKSYSVEEVKATQIEIPSLKNFYIAKTSLNQGYLYLIDDFDKENKYFEYEVKDDGSFSTISWGYNKNSCGEYLDVRTSENDSLNFKILTQSKKLWIAFSHHQWSRDYLLKKMIGNDELRRKRMVLFDCSGIKIGSEDKYSNVVPYTEINLVHYNDHLNYGVQQKLIDQIRFEEEKQDVIGDNNIYQDMFIALDDPMGCANDIGNILVNAYNKLDSIIESIQTGENDLVVFKNLQNGTEESTVSLEYKKQIGGLFSTALSTYQMIYNDKEMEDKFGGDVDKSKLLKILAVSERKEQRKIINSFRTDFGNFLSSDYYKKFFNNYTDGGPQELFEGKCIIPLHLTLLAINPHDKDRHLDLKKDFTGKNDIWAGFFDDVLKNNSAFDKILRHKLNSELLKQSIFDAQIGFKLSRRLVKCMNTILDAYAKFAVRGENFNVVLDYMKAFTYKGQTIIQIRADQAGGAKQGFTIDLHKMIEQDKLVDNNKGHYGNDRIRIKTNLRLDEAKMFAVNKAIDLTYKGQGNKAATMIKEVLGSPRFRSFLAALELVNAAVSFDKYSRNGSYKNELNLMGAVANLTSSSTAYLEARMLQKGFKSSSKAIIITKSLSKISGFAGSGISVTMCVWDSVESYQSRDYDASLVWGLTAVVSGILLADGIFVFATGATVGFLGFWPVLVLSALFFGGMFIALYLTDTPLEKYLKNYALSDAENLTSGNEKPFEYIEKIYNQRTRLVNDKFYRWRDFNKAANDFYDLIISYRVTRENMEFYAALDDEDVRKSKSIMDEIRDVFQMSAGIVYKNSKKLKITIALRKFLYEKSEFHFSLILLPNGINDTAKKHYLINQKSIIDDSEGMDILNLIYQIPENLHKNLSLSSEFIFLSRTVINETVNEFWPSQDQTIRFHAYKFSAVEFINPTTSPAFIEDFRSVYGINVRFGSEVEIFNETTWKLN